MELPPCLFSFLFRLLLSGSHESRFARTGLFLVPKHFRYNYRRRLENSKLFLNDIVQIIVWWDLFLEKLCKLTLVNLLNLLVLWHKFRVKHEPLFNKLSSLLILVLLEFQIENLHLFFIISSLASVSFTWAACRG